MVREPAVYLLDEPLSNLDAQLRAHTRAELARLRDRLRVTTVYVTHDQIEAMTLGDRVAVLKDGVLQQVATPRELFDHPENAFVAGFIGSPDMNLVHADVVERRLHFGGHDLPVPDGVTLPSGRIIVGIRPSKFSQIGPDAPPATPRMEVTVDVVELLGEEMRVMFPVAAPSGAVFGSVPSPTSQPEASELLAPAGAAPAPRRRSSRPRSRRTRRSPPGDDSRSPSTRAPCTSSIRRQAGRSDPRSTHARPKSTRRSERATSTVRTREGMKSERNVGSRR